MLLLFSKQQMVIAAGISIGGVMCRAMYWKSVPAVIFLDRTVDDMSCMEWTRKRDKKCWLEIVGRGCSSVEKER